MPNSQSSETINLASTSDSETFQIGRSLASSLVTRGTTIWLTGELGAGKTTMAKGLGAGLRLGDEVTSPTFALENRYGEKLLHMDLYRLDEKEATRLVEESSDFPGVRVIEWSERVTNMSSRPSTALGTRVSRDIFISIQEPTQESRSINITFNDLPMPSRQQIEGWRTELRLPDHIGIHCDAVGKCAKELAEELLKRNTVTRPLAMQRAGELHDLLRFVDFQPKVQAKIPHAKEVEKETEQHWEMLRKEYGPEHEAATASFLEQKGYPELASIISVHGLNVLVNAPETIRTTEQKLLNYSDKRVQYDKVVTLDERFDDFVERYSDGKETEYSRTGRERMKRIERELFG